MQRLISLVAVCVVLTGAVALLQGAVPCAALAAQPACQVALRPGPSEDATELIDVSGTRSYPASGELRLATVAVQDHLDVAGWLRARFAPNVVAVPREQIYPTGVDPDAVAEQNAALMMESQLTATVAALEELGHEVEGEGARVVAVQDDAATDALEPGDVITGLDGAPVGTSQQVVDAVAARSPGEVVVLEVAGAERRRAVEVTLGVAPDDPERAYVGVVLTTALELPVDVAIDAGVIGGPSAGLMFALSIVELLGEEDLTEGRVIAGTGTLDQDGVVGPVGGVQQKVAGATSGVEGEPAEVFLVPPANLPQARAAAVNRDVMLVPVTSLDDALDALEELRAGQAPEDAQLLAARS